MGEFVVEKTVVRDAQGLITKVIERRRPLAEMTVTPEAFALEHPELFGGMTAEELEQRAAMKQRLKDSVQQLEQLGLEGRAMSAFKLGWKRSRMEGLLAYAQRILAEL